jgi:hypothetical protein
MLHLFNITLQGSTEQNISSEKIFAARQIRITDIKIVQKVHSHSNIQKIHVVIELRYTAP